MKLSKLAAKIQRMLSAIKANDLSAVKAFIEETDWKNPDTPFGTWLHIAARKNKYDVVKLLLQLGCDPNVRSGALEGNALNTAALEGNVQIIQLLIQNGAKIDTDDTINNPLFTVVHSSNIAAVKALIGAGADYKVTYNWRGIPRFSASSFARVMGETKIAEYLEGLDPSFDPAFNSGRDDLPDSIKHSKC